MKQLTKRQILSLHQALIEAYGGSEGLRDEGLLDSALAVAFQVFDGQPLLPTLQQKAARLGFGIIMNHPFVDGNKRTGAHVMLMTLELNGIELEYSQQELYEAIIKVAAGEATFEVLLEWILAHDPYRDAEKG